MQLKMPLSFGLALWEHMRTIYFTTAYSSPSCFFYDTSYTYIKKTKLEMVKLSMIAIKQLTKPQITKKFGQYWEGPEVIKM